MKNDPGCLRPLALCCLGVWVFGCLGVCGAVAASEIPPSELDAFESAVRASSEAHSDARQRLAVRRAIRSGEALLEAHPDSADRFRVLGVLFRARQQLLELEATDANREALLAVCRQLAQAPDDYAEVRFDAELLLSQTEQAREGATPSERAAALRPLLERYLGTPVEKRMLQMLTLMTLEWGHDGMLYDLRQTIAERHWRDLDMVRFTRDKLGGQVLGAPFVGNLQTSDGRTAVFPMDRLGRSTVYFFWSKDAEDLDARIASWNALAGYATCPKDPEVTHRLTPDLIDIISINLDELPDAGAAILREKGVGWQALHLPGGRESEIYRTYARWDPMGLHVSPSGCAALLLPGLHKDDYPRRVWSYVERNTYYLRQLEWLFTGEYLVVDALAAFDPAAPPELKMHNAGNASAVLLPRTAASVPTNVLQAIQSCFVPPPERYRLTHAEALGNYRKAETLCRAAIAAHPEAPDLWLVQNRLIVALMGQWRMTSDTAWLTRAGEVAETALAGELPAGADVVSRLCLARLALRSSENDPAVVIESFVDACGGEETSGSAVAAATYLALDVGSRRLHEKYRRILLDKHDDNAMTWSVAAPLLDRFHRYQMFFHPYHRGWSFGRRQARYYQSGTPQDATRVLQADFQTLEGGTVRFPDQTGKAWNVIVFGVPSADGTTIPAADVLKQVKAFAAHRDPGEVKPWLALLRDPADGGVTGPGDGMRQQTLLVPGGLRNPAVQRLGIFAIEAQPNMVILRPDGTIAVMVSGLSWHATSASTVLQNTLELADEAAIDALLAAGDHDAALRLALRWAPEEASEPNAKHHADGISQVHLRSRAKVYIAMRNWQAALADVDTLADRQLQEDSRMSKESQDLIEALRLQAIVHERLDLHQVPGEKR